MLMDTYNTYGTGTRAAEGLGKTYKKYAKYGGLIKNRKRKLA